MFDIDPTLMWTFYSSHVAFNFAQLWLGSAKIHLLHKFYLFSVKKKKKNEKAAGVFTPQQTWWEDFTNYKPNMSKKSYFLVPWAPRTSFDLLLRC